MSHKSDCEGEIKEEVIVIVVFSNAEVLIVPCWAHFLSVLLSESSFLQFLSNKLSSR